MQQIWKTFCIVLSVLQQNIYDTLIPTMSHSSTAGESNWCQKHGISVNFIKPETSNWSIQNCNLSNSALRLLNNKDPKPQFLYSSILLKNTVSIPISITVTKKKLSEWRSQCLTCRAGWNTCQVELWLHRTSEKQHSQDESQQARSSYVTNCATAETTYGIQPKPFKTHHD